MHFLDYSYYRGLSEWPREKGWLMDTCRDGQDTFKVLLNMPGIPYEKETKTV